MGDWSPTGGGDIKVDTDGVMGFAKNVGQEMMTFQGNISGGVNPLTSTAMTAVGRSGIDSAVFFQQQHSKYFQAAMLMVADAQKGLMALQQGGFTVAANYLNADAESAAKVGDVVDAFNPPPGRTSLDDLLSQEPKDGEKPALPTDQEVQDRIDQVTAQDGSPLDPSGQSDAPASDGTPQDKVIDMGDGTTYTVPGDYQGVESTDNQQQVPNDQKTYEESWDGNEVPYYDPGPPTTAI